MCKHCAKEDLGFDTEDALFEALHTWPYIENGFSAILQGFVDEYNDEGYGLCCDACGVEIDPPYCVKCGRTDLPLEEGEYGMVCSECLAKDKEEEEEE